MQSRYHFMGVYLHHDRQRAAIVRMSCVTDFAARTDEAKALADKAAMMACAVGSDPSDVMSAAMHDGYTFADHLARTAKALGEELKIESVFVDSAKR